MVFNHYTVCLWQKTQQQGLRATQATLSIASSEHQFTGHTTQHHKALWLTDDEDVDHGYVVADITHKLHQKVGPWAQTGVGWGVVGRLKLLTKQSNPSRSTLVFVLSISFGIKAWVFACSRAVPPPVTLTGLRLHHTWTCSGISES
jgi:hypothetical protein